MAHPLRTILSAAAALLSMASIAPAAAQEPPPYPPLDSAQAEAVRDVVRRYQDAIRARDGDAAARLVTRETREYYGRMRDMAVSASEAQVRAAPLMDRVNILLYRHRVPAAELRALPAARAFAHTISAGWVTATEGYDLARHARAFGEGDRAVLRYDGDTHFARENGVWLWDMMPTIRIASDELGANLPTPEAEDEFLVQVLTLSNGRAPLPTIWRPLQ